MAKSYNGCPASNRKKSLASVQHICSESKLEREFMPPQHAKAGVKCKTDA